MDTEIISPNAHSDLVGGSSAAKRLACPGSYQQEKLLPPSIGRDSSSYADEGSAMHDCMAYILDNDITNPDDVEGMVFGANQTDRESYKMDREMMLECIIPAMTFFDQLCDDAEAEGGLDFMVEKRCELPGIPGAFGTSDLIARTEQRSIILDWKFGAGVPVKAAYPELQDDGTVVMKPNPQLMFYARAAMHTFPDMFEDRPSWPVELIIVQPRGRADEYEKDGKTVTVDEQRITRFTTTVNELEKFRFDLVRAVAEATGENPRLKKGEHCRFAKCKAICPLWTGPALDLTRMHDALMVKDSPDYLELDAQDERGELDWGALYAQLLDWCEIAGPLITEIQSQAHAFVEEGQAMPGWKMVEGRLGNRNWVDADKAEKYLARQGLAVDERREVKTISPTVAEKLLKTKGKTLDDKYIAPRTPGKAKLARADDHRAELIAPAELVQRLGQRLAALQG